MGFILDVSFATIGMKGRKNQDNLIIDKFVTCCSELQIFKGSLRTDITEKRLFAVSDGAGGCVKGEVASALTVGAFSRNLDNLKTEDAETALNNTLDEANISVVSFYKNEDGTGAATISGLLFENSEVVLFNAGDSPVYLIHDGMLERVSQEHTLSGETGLGKKTIADNTITKYMGNPMVSGSEAAYKARFRICHDMILIIASDGIEKGLSEKEIKKISSKKEVFVAESMVKQAEKNGVSDDITAIVVKISDETYIAGCE